VKYSHSTTDKPVLLLLDNHESHLSVDGIQFAKDNGIHLLSFPPHCSHRLQPLDCTVYFPLKKCDSWCNSHPGRPMQPLDIPGVCAMAFKLAMTPANIQSGFEVTGIFPFNRSRIQDDEFLPSAVTDRPISDVPFGECISPSVFDNQTTAQTMVLVPEVHSAETSVMESCALNSDDQQKDASSPQQSVCSLNQAVQPVAGTSAEKGIKQSAAKVGLSTPLSPASTPSVHNCQTTPRSLLEIRPLPKAGPRTTTKTGRKRGRTRILTDTQKKLQIEKEAAERNSAKKPKTCAKSRKSDKKNDKKAGKKNKQCRKSLLIREKEMSESEEEEETFCLVCAEPFSNSRPGEKWVQCVDCHMWAHVECTDGSVMYVCQNCDSCDDM